VYCGGFEVARQAAIEGSREKTDHGVVGCFTNMYTVQTDEFMVLFDLCLKARRCNL
jgi:hypothetical protein